MNYITLILCKSRTHTLVTQLSMVYEDRPNHTINFTEHNIMNMNRLHYPHNAFGMDTKSLTTYEMQVTHLACYTQFWPQIRLTCCAPTNGRRFATFRLVVRMLANTHHEQGYSTFWMTQEHQACPVWNGLGIHSWVPHQSHSKASRGPQLSHKYLEM